MFAGQFLTMFTRVASAAPEALLLKGWDEDDEKASARSERGMD